MVDQEPPFKTEPLGNHHDRAAFSCESAAQTQYFRATARQHEANDLSAVFVMVEVATKRIAGFYTLSMHAIDAGEIPPEAQKKCRLPKHGALSAALIGRLARDLNFKGRGIGSLLAYDALNRIREARKLMGCAAVIVDPDGDEALRFWLKLQFRRLPDQTRLFLPMATVKALP